MPAAITDYFNETTNGTRPSPTTVTGTRSSGVTTLQCAALTGWSTATAVHFATYSTDAQGEKDSSTQCDWKGIVSGTQITNLTLKAGTDAGNVIGDTVVCMPTAAWADDVVEGLVVEHTQLGRHVMTSPKMITDISDTNGNELFKITATGSAVNEFTVANAATGNAPALSATGSDSNIDVNFVPKGTGEVTKAGNPIDWWEEIGRTTLGTAGDTVSVTSLPARKYLKVIFSLTNSGSVTGNLRLNNDSGNNYAWRKSVNGAAETAASSTSSMSPDAGGNAYPIYGELTIINISAAEKIVYGQIYPQAATTAVTAPVRIEFAGKWVNTSSQISRVDFVNTDTGDYAIGSEVIVLGHD